MMIVMIRQGHLLANHHFCSKSSTQLGLKAQHLLCSTPIATMIRMMMIRVMINLISIVIIIMMTISWAWKLNISSAVPLLWCLWWTWWCRMSMMIMIFTTVTIIVIFIIIIIAVIIIIIIIIIKIIAAFSNLHLVMIMIMLTTIMMMMIILMTSSNLPDTRCSFSQSSAKAWSLCVPSVGQCTRSPDIGMMIVMMMTMMMNLIYHHDDHNDYVHHHYHHAPYHLNLHIQEGSIKKVCHYCHHHHDQRCKKRQIWQIYLCYFSKAVLILGPWMETK